jgi:hypothetical protein
MNDQLADWLAARLERCLPTDQWNLDNLEKLLAELRKTA